MTRPGRADTALPPELAALATRLGIEMRYWDLLGKRHDASIDTARALCAAMGYDAGCEARAAESVRDFDRARSERCIEPVRVWREHARARPRLHVCHPGGEWRARVQVTDEHERARSLELPLPGAPAGRIVTIPLPGPFEPGHHQLELELSRGREERSARQHLFVTPRTALRFREKLGARRIAGLWTNLYSVRSARSWGFGDTGDLQALVRASGEAGVDFVGTNPLHATRIAPGGSSPYSPVSRFYRSPLYIDVEAVPELAACDPARRMLANPRSRAARQALRDADRLDCAAVWAQKQPVLRELHRAFQSGADAARRARFEAYRSRGGSALEDFATFQVLAADGPGRDGDAWTRWPSELRDPRSRAVATFRELHAEAIAFEVWLQFELDEQLAAVARTAAASGHAIGLYFDLAIGSARDSADTWARPGCHARDVSLGAPPDAYAPDGQVWGLPPLDPGALRREGYETWRRLLAASLRHAGALRIDHVMAVQRQFWVPDGGTAADGAYVRFPADDLLGILALESRRHGALVIGEDLGTVPPDLPGRLASWGILSSSVFLFERRGDGFATPSQLSPRALASVGTHDLAPLAGYAAGRDLELRAEASAIERDAAPARSAARRNELAALVERLRCEGLLSTGETPAPEALRRGLARLLGRSGAPLVGISLDDVAGEREPINLPGVPIEAHPSWTRRMTAPLEGLLDVRRLREELPRASDRSDRPKSA